MIKSTPREIYSRMSARIVTQVAALQIMNTELAFKTIDSVINNASAIRRLTKISHFSFIDSPNIQSFDIGELHDQIKNNRQKISKLEDFQVIVFNFSGDKFDLIHEQNIIFDQKHLRAQISGSLISFSIVHADKHDPIGSINFDEEENLNYIIDNLVDLRDIEKLLLGQFKKYFRQNLSDLVFCSKSPWVLHGRIEKKVQNIIKNWLENRLKDTIIDREVMEGFGYLDYKFRNTDNLVYHVELKIVGEIQSTKSSNTYKYNHRQVKGGIKQLIYYNNNSSYNVDKDICLILDGEIGHPSSSKTYPNDAETIFVCIIPQSAPTR